MARDENKGLGVTFKIGPGQKLMKDSMEGPLYVGPRKKESAPVKPKAKPEAKKPDVKMPKRPVTPTPRGKPKADIFNPLTSTSVTGGDVESGAAAVKAKRYGDSTPPAEVPGKRFNPLTSTYYKDGGKIDGVAVRGKTKGRYC